MTGLSFAMSHMFGVMIGNVQGGVIDLLVFGILGGSQTAWWYTVIIGAAYFPLYYFMFRFVITRMNVKTPGREDEPQNDAAAAMPASEKTAKIIEGLGGSNNIQIVDCCFTRLRVKVADMGAIHKDTLIASGASGIKQASDVDIQVIYGPQVEKIANDVKRALTA